MTATEPSSANGIEERIGLWRTYLLRRNALSDADVDELEDHLRGVMASLSEVGLSPDEAFLVAVKRIGAVDALTREFAREHSDRLWKQLVKSNETVDTTGQRVPEIVIVLALAVTAALAFKLPTLLGYPLVDGNEGLYVRNLSLFVLPCLFGYFAWKRGLDRRSCLLAALAFVAAGCINAYPFGPAHTTEVLVVLHMPIALWLVIGVAYTGGNWASSAHRMNFVRFSGELFIYYVLIALGGGVLTAFTMFSFVAIGFDPERLAETLLQPWLIPCGALGAVIVGAWLVEAKQSVIENMAPVLTRLFTPLFAAVLLTFLGTMAWTGSVVEVEREILIGFDLLLVLVLGMLLYSVSARDPQAKPEAFDVVQLVLVVSALVVDIVALSAIAARISEFGFSANKVAALGENLVLLVNLSWSAWLYLKFLRGRGPFSALERWQTSYLPVYAGWAAFVVVIFPPLFDFV